MDKDRQHWMVADQDLENIVLSVKTCSLPNGPATLILCICECNMMQHRASALPWIANNSALMMLTPIPLSALHSNSIFPVICSPATKKGSENCTETFAFGC